jgi:hypothetical protein
VEARVESFKVVALCTWHACSTGDRIGTVAIL